MEITLEVESMDAIWWWVDAAYGVHKILKDYSGGMDDHMPGVLWKLRFLRGHGFKKNKNIVYQDNQSAILIENNGKYSRGKKIRHIDMRYFFITDPIE